MRIKKIYFNFIKHVNVPGITFVKFNQNHYMGIINKNTNLKKNYGIHVLLVALQILLGSLLLVNHLVYGLNLVS
jgi:hypothetical protein